MNNSLTLKEISLNHLADSNAVSGLFMIVGMLAIATGMVSSITILKTKELRTKFYILYFGVAIDDIIMGAGYMGMAAKRFSRYISGIGEVMPRWLCCWESSVLYFSQTLGLYMALTLAIDRMFSTSKPILYKYMKNHYLTYPLIAGAWFLSMFETIYMICQGYTEKEDVLISCGTASCWLRFSKSITLYTHLGISFVIIATNLVLIVLVRYQLKRATKHKSNGYLAHSKNNLQVKVLKTLTLVIVSHSTSHISTRLGLLILMYQSVEDPELTPLGIVLRNLVVINAASHFFIYYTTSCEFRDGVKKLFSMANLKRIFGGSTSVHPS